MIPAMMSLLGTQIEDNPSSKKTMPKTTVVTSELTALGERASMKFLMSSKSSNLNLRWCPMVKNDNKGLSAGPFGLWPQCAFSP
jgi:hypothetical protein